LSKFAVLMTAVDARVRLGGGFLGDFKEQTCFEVYGGNE
jgi:hypothetical protein